MARKMNLTVQICRAVWADPDINLPEFHTKGSAGADLRANLRRQQRAQGLTIEPGGRALVPLGFSIEIPEGFEGQIRSRSGFALKHGVIVLNSPGTIDSDYRGEVGVVLMNLDSQRFIVEHGVRIAQLLIKPVTQTSFECVPSISLSDRGAGGFGSTGTE